MSFAWTVDKDVNCNPKRPHLRRDGIGGVGPSSPRRLPSSPVPEGGQHFH